MSDKPENCPAFPVHDGAAPIWTHGMSLRDYFAARAMQAVIANETALRIASGLSKQEGKDSEHGIADLSYKMADAMLKARKA